MPSRSPSSSRPARTESAVLRGAHQCLHPGDRRRKDDEEIRVEAHLQRGVLHEQAGNKEAAIKDYSEIDQARSHRTRSPTSIEATSTTSSASTICAIADYTEAIKLDPTDPDAFNNRGQAYDNKGEYDLAIADYTQSIRLNSDNARAFFNRGLALAIKGEHQRAVADFTQAIKLEPRRRRGLCQSGGGL